MDQGLRHTNAVEAIPRIRRSPTIVPAVRRPPRYRSTRLDWGTQNFTGESVKYTLVVPCLEAKGLT